MIDIVEPPAHTDRDPRLPAARGESTTIVRLALMDCSPERAVVTRRGQHLQWLTIGWNAAALVMVPLIARKGWEAVRGRTCCE